MPLAKFQFRHAQLVVFWNLWSSVTIVDIFILRMLKTLSPRFFRRFFKVDCFTSESAKVHLRIDGKQREADFSAIWLRFGKNLKRKSKERHDSWVFKIQLPLPWLPTTRIGSEDNISSFLAKRTQAETRCFRGWRSQIQPRRWRPCGYDSRRRSSKICQAKFQILFHF